MFIKYSKRVWKWWTVREAGMHLVENIQAFDGHVKEGFGAHSKDKWADIENSKQKRAMIWYDSSKISWVRFVENGLEELSGGSRYVGRKPLVNYSCGIFWLQRLPDTSVLLWGREGSLLTTDLREAGLRQNLRRCSFRDYATAGSAFTRPGEREPLYI